MQRRYRKRPPKQQMTKRFRVNRQITAPEVRLVNEEEGTSDVVSIAEALARADELGLDLVEVSPKAEPPVVRITDFGQVKYEQEKKARKQRAQQKKTETKGIRLTFRIKGQDLDTRKQQALKFLDAGNNVKVELMLRGRERAHRDKAIEIVKQFVADLGDDATQVSPINKQGGRLSIEVTRKSS